MNINTDQRGILKENAAEKRWKDNGATEEEEP